MRTGPTIHMAVEMPRMMMYHFGVRGLVAEIGSTGGPRRKKWDVA